MSAAWLPWSAPISKRLRAAWQAFLRPPETNPVPFSLDEAAALVPANCNWLVNSRGKWAHIWTEKESGLDDDWQAFGDSPAQALMLAACKARVHLK